ncbi:hypothetical protein NliqN6_4871 [Naganishia liquefaciens]|uniref:Uncharacterized protein n=1 Tax=Naganishia liquefaciens TaxID=104408 RepID=A0A8H3TWP2_9TREE|nr:hypothetical protein NliqN6_4871 [Naganishia liquefaciens]
MSDQRPSHIEIPSSGMNGTTVENAKADVEMQDGGASPVRDEHEVNRRRAPNGPFTPLGDPSFKPRGILKNSRSQSGSEQMLTLDPQARPGEHLHWDENNIALTEIERDSVMKIDEPKTPFVHSDPGKDVLDIDDDFSLSSPSARRDSAGPSSASGMDGPTTPNGVNWQATFDPAIVAANTARNAGHPRPPGFPHVAGTDSLTADSDHATMAQALESPPHPPVRRRTSSTGTNSRSASFSLPGQKSGHQMSGHVSPGGEVAEDDEDEPLNPEDNEKHKEFKQKRKGHYSNEAEAMRLAQSLMAQETPEDENDEQ